MPPAGALRLRDGHGPAGGYRSMMADRGSCHPVCRRPRQSRAALPPGVQVVRTVARSTWTPGGKPAPPRCGTTADGMAVRGCRAGGLRNDLSMFGAPATWSIRLQHVQI
jgi:hypothetical protein